MARHNYLIGHNTSPDRNKPNPSPNRPHAAEPTRKALVTRESMLTEGVYERTWQVAVDNRNDIKLIVIYTWNEHEEHAAIEPDKGVSPVSYGRSLVEKTATYYRQFTAGQPITALR